jgi:hypothetical protein
MTGGRQGGLRWRLPGRGLGRRLAADRRGLAGIEFAIVLPVLVVLSLVTLESGRFLLLNLKLSHATSSMADLATRERDLSVATLDALFASVPHIIQPFPIGRDGVVIVSGVSEAASGALTVGWQRRGAGPLGAASHVGTAGGGATLPPGVPVGAGQTMVVAEGFYQYQPWLLGVIPAQVLRKVAYYRPRLGVLTRLS